MAQRIEIETSRVLAAREMETWTDGDMPWQDVVRRLTRAGVPSGHARLFVMEMADIPRR